MVPLPGNGTPHLAETSISVWAAAYGEVVDQIGRYGERTGTDHLLLRVQWPGLGQRTVLQTLERLGRVVEQIP